MTHGFRLLIVSVAVTLLVGCASTEFSRVEQFPQGQQINLMTSALLSGKADANTVQRAYNAPYDRVWTAAKLVAERLDKIGRRPVVGIDEKNGRGRIQNGQLNESALVGRGTGSWADEFFIEVSKLSDTQTKVLVARRVVEKELVSTGNVFRQADRQWRAQFSNGQIESWIHTQIESEPGK